MLPRHTKHCRSEKPSPGEFLHLSHAAPPVMDLGHRPAVSAVSVLETVRLKGRSHGHRPFPNYDSATSALEATEDVVSIERDKHPRGRKPSDSTNEDPEAVGYTQRGLPILEVKQASRGAASIPYESKYETTLPVP